MNDVWRNCIFPLVSPIDLARLRQCSKFLNRLLEDNEVLKEWKNRLTTALTETTVIEAVKTGHCDLVSLISSFSTFNAHATKALLAALNAGHFKVVKLFFNNRRYISKRETFSRYSIDHWAEAKLLCAAIKGGNVDCINWALARSPPDFGTSSQEANAALVKQFLASNADDLENGLFGAALGGDFKSMEFLLSQDRAVKNACLWTAARHYHAKLIDFFICNCGARYFELAMEGAAYGGHIDLMEYLQYRGARNLESALVSATEGGHVDVVKYLLDKIVARNCESAVNKST